MSDGIFTILQMALAFGLILAPLVFVHELGHFLVAKAFGIGVPVFSLGFGPRLLGFRRGGTDYRLSAIPLGGYVRLAGDESDDSRTGAPHEFLSRPKYQRFLVFIAGATCNLLTAFVALWVLFAIYGKQDTPASYPVIDTVRAGSPAEAAGVEAGDRLLAIGGQDIKDPESLWDTYLIEIVLSPGKTKPIVVQRGTQEVPLTLTLGSDAKDGSGDPGWSLSYGGPVAVVDVFDDQRAQQAGLRPGDRIHGAAGREPLNYLELRLALANSPEQPVPLRIERDGQRLELTVTPRSEGGQGKIGAVLSPVAPLLRRLSVMGAARESVRTNLQLSKTLFVVLKRLISRELPLRTMSGPIGIADAARRALVAGMDEFLLLLGFFSLQLGILNLLPIPVLDGGHILILAVEGLIRRDLSERIKERVMQVGFAFLIALMGVIVVMDFVKLKN